MSKLGQGTEPDADYIIIGAGSAGCLLANRLSAGTHSVLLVEAGGPDRHPLIHIPAGFVKLLDHPRISWGFRTEAAPGTANRVLDYPRGRVWGGSSSINGLGHVRGPHGLRSMGAERCRRLGLGRAAAVFRPL